MRPMLPRPNVMAVMVLSLIGAGLLPGVSRAAHAYVSNEDEDTVTVIDTGRGEAVGTIVVGKRPRGIKVDPSGARLYVAVSGLPKCPPTTPDEECAKLARDRDADGVAVVDLATRRLLRVLPAGSDPEQFDVTRDGRRVFVSNEDSGRVSVLDVASGRVAGTIAVGREPEGVRIAPDGRWVLVTSETESAVSIIDARTRTVLKSVPVGLRPRDMAFTPDSTTAYVTGEADASLHRITVPGGETQKVLQLRTEARPMGIVLDAQHSRAYVSTGRGGTVAVIAIAGEPRLETEIPVGKRPWGIALSADGRELYTANGPSNDVTIVDTEKLTVTRHIAVGKGPWGVVVGP